MNLRAIPLKNKLKVIFSFESLIWVFVWFPLFLIVKLLNLITEVSYLISDLCNKIDSYIAPRLMEKLLK